MMAQAQIDLDHDATTPVDPRVLDRFLGVEAACPGNPSSAHAAGRRARLVLEDARTEVATALGIDSDAVVFVSGGTEANHCAIRGLGDATLPLLTSIGEHKSVHAAAESRGLVLWKIDREARAVVERPLEGVGLVALGHAQGEVGALQPIRAAAELARELGVPFHVDAAQTLGRVPLLEPLRSADTVSISAHKAGGLRGASVLLVLGARPRPLLTGGGQEGGLRSGTVSPSLAAATARAIALAVAELGPRAAAMRAARDALAEELDERVPLERLTPHGEELPNTLLVRFPGIDGHALLPALDLAGVLASAGSACSSGAPEPPAVLLAMGYAVADARCCVRFSTAPATGIETARDAARRIAAVVDRLRARHHAGPERA